MDNNNEFLSWDNMATDGKVTEFVDLEPGLYKFTVTGFERKATDHATKAIPMGCPYAEVSCKVETEDGQTKTLNDRIYMMQKFKWKINQLFVSVGIVTEDTNGVIDWSKLIGSSGVLETYKNEYNGQQYDRIRRFLTPNEVKKAAEKESKPASNKWTI